MNYINWPRLPVTLKVGSVNEKQQQGSLWVPMTTLSLSLFCSKMMQLPITASPKVLHHF